ncbi:MAG: RHS repeat-associated core domain-containing protein [Bacteroidaceae bacterium]|nr:RHS repeat-associated core domain-containing protein [Bacteroidaceae bacterium]
MTTAHMGNPTTYSYPPDGLSGIVRYDSRTSTYTPYAVETDHLGSITSLYNSSGTKVMGASFDAWGKRTQTTSTLEFRRGFTGHEHIDGFDLINMNGRVYDPLIGRFLSPDMYVQLPGFSQSFNRYSYCLNNPLKYTDPDGEWFWIPAVVIGAYVGGSSVNGTFNPAKWDYDTWQTYAGIAVGGLAGYAGAAIGASVVASALASGASSISAGVAGGMMGGMVSGGINGAGMTAIMGGNINDIMYNMTKGMLMGRFGGAISGGIGAAIGDFSGVAGGPFKNGMYELGHSALKGVATGLSEGAMMAAMEQDPNYLWKGALMGAALNTGMAGLRIAALGTSFIPDSKYGTFEDFGQVYRRGSIFIKNGAGITLGRNVSVQLTGDIEYDRYLLKHETGHLSQINITGNGKFYYRTAKEYMTNGFFNTYKTSGTLEYGANFYAFQRLGYYYLLGIKRTTFP